MGRVDFQFRQQYPIISKNIISVRPFIIFCSVTAIYTLFLSVKTIYEGTSAELIQSSTKNIGNDLIYILLWTPEEYSPFYHYEKGQKAFLKNNCSYTNCYVTSDRDLLGGDITKFDAIAFNGRSLDGRKVPEMRSPKQKYIYFNTESSDNCLVCDKDFDGFFNWTATYRLDSDVPLPYLDIRDKNNNIIGPKRDMHWKKMGAKVFDNDLYEKWRNKTKAAAWFVSNCSSRSNRTALAMELQKAMKPYDMEIYIYGKCGKLQCPRNKHADCAKMLESNFYFYLSFENSFAEDYVTEKLLTAVQHDMVPIVFGGANYSRFLPPDSYLDASELTPEEIASKMFSIIHSPRLYERYFKWRNYYTYYNRIVGKESINTCDLCKALNDKSVMNKQQIYKRFREWWNPNYRNRCS